MKKKLRMAEIFCSKFEIMPSSRWSESSAAASLILSALFSLLSCKKYNKYPNLHVDKDLCKSVFACVV